MYHGSGKGGSGIARATTPTSPIARVRGVPLDDKFDYAFKVVLCGNSGVGKTTLCSTLVGRDASRTAATIGIDFAVKHFQLSDGKRVLMQVWDTAGVERFASLPNMYLRDAHAICLVYDVASEESYRGILTRWRPDVRQHAPESAIVFVIANKIDLTAVVDETMARREIEKEWGWTFLKSNALRSDSVNPVMTTVASAAAAYARAPSPRTEKRILAAIDIENGKDPSERKTSNTTIGGTVVVVTDNAGVAQQPPTCYC